MNESVIRLERNGAAAVPGGRVLLGYAGNRGNYRLRIEPHGEWEGLTIRAHWHTPGGSGTTLVQNGLLDIPEAVTAVPGNGCITFEGTDGERTVTSADVACKVCANSGTADGDMPQPGTPAWEAFLKEVQGRTELSIGLVTSGTKPDASIADGKLNLVLPRGDRGVSMEKAVIYYGYPVGINNTWTVEGAAAVYRQYDLCVFGDTYELPEQEVYAETVALMALLQKEAPGTRMVGYVPIGVQNVGADSGLSMDELKRRVGLWKGLGASGIFLDEFGYDYGVTRARQNEIVQYVHAQGMFCIANSWNQSYVFSSLPMTLDWDHFEANPDGLPPELNSGDYSLLENFFYSCERNSETGKVTLHGSSCWRVDDGYAYYTRAQEEYGKTYYEQFGTKLLQLDAIPHDLSAREKNTLMTLSVIGAKIFNIPALAFGDEDWGSSGYYYEWGIPTAIDLTEDGSKGLHAVTVQQRGEDPDSFPYRWSALVGGNQLELVFDVADGNDETWDAEKRYVSVNGVKIRNAWETIYEFSQDMAAMKTQCAQAVETAGNLQKEVADALPTVTSAEERMKALVADTQEKLDTAAANVQKTIDSALADVSAVTTGFGFREVQW